MHHVLPRGGGCENYGPFWDAPKDFGRKIRDRRKGTIALPSYHTRL